MALQKELGFWAVFSIAAGAMISSGLFVLPAVVYSRAQSGIFYAYLLAGILMIPALLAQLELVSAIPKAGGTYFFTERILGTGAGVVAGFANWFSISLKSAFALVGIGAFALLLFPGLSDMHFKLIAGGACLIFTLSNIFSVEASGKIQIILVVILIAILLQFVFFGRQVLPSLTPYKDLAQPQWKYILYTTGMVFVSYGGLTKIASVAEEVRNPRKNLVWGALSAFIVVQILYLLVIFILIGMLSPQEFSQTLTPVSAAALKFIPGSRLAGVQFILTAVAAMLAFITTANAGIMAASRSPLGMSRDGLIPSQLGIINPRTKTPLVSILLTMVFMMLIIFFLDTENLAKVASLFMLILFIMTNVALLVIRQSGISNYKPSFKTPGYPVTPILGMVAYIFLITQMGMITLVIALSFIALCLLWYFVYARKRVQRKSAFVHMIRKVTNPELILDTDGLEEELLDILINRNEIIEDRFDRLIRQAPVLDYTHSITRDQLFQDISALVAEKWDIPVNSLLQKLIQREESSQTLIYPGVALPHAIPHIIIEGEGRFDIVLVRNKAGIIWNEQDEKVYTAFCLIGTKDERNFHLQALMAIAQVLQNPVFHKEWMTALTDKDLRSIILLSHRKRL